MKASWLTFQLAFTVLRKRAEGTFLLRLVALGSPLGFLALEAGWIVTEAGRQPWIVYHVLRTAEDRRSRAAELFGWVREGRLKVHVAARFPLAEGAAAHAFLESRRSSGKVLLIP